MKDAAIGARLPFERTNAKLTTSLVREMRRCGARHDLVTMGAAGFVERVAWTTPLETDERNLYWRISRRFVPTLYRLKGNSRPLPFVEEIAIPPSYLPEFLVRVQNILKAHQITATMFAHAGHGQLHIRPFLDLANPEDVRKMQLLADDLYQIVLDVGGTISGEHGVGTEKLEGMRLVFSEDDLEFQRQLRGAFDPQGLLNPGNLP